MPDISKWNINNVSDIRGMFYGCISLSSLPNLSKWNINIVSDMKSIFCECENLILSKQILKEYQNYPIFDEDSLVSME